MSYIGKLTKIQDNILLCHNTYISNNLFIGSVLYIYKENVNINNLAKGILLEISTKLLKRLLLEGNASDIKIDYKASTKRSGLYIPVGFNILGKNKVSVKRRMFQSARMPNSNVRCYTTKKT